MMRKITGPERDALIQAIINRIESDTQVVGAPERAAVWQRGWTEALEKFRADPREESLVPAFIHSDQPVRWHQEFYYQDADFSELSFARQVQHDIAEYFDGLPYVTEFGCGTGWNIVALAKLLPDTQFYAFDSSIASVLLIEQIAARLKVNVVGGTFDMRAPNDDSGTFTEPMGVFTFGAIEQLAGEFQPFMEYLIRRRPSIVVHVEPVIELLDPAKLVDALAIAFMKKRGYTTGLLPWLQNDPRVEMIHVERTYFGSLMLEGYNWIVWKPN